MNKVYENPEAKVVLFQSTEKMALLSNEDGITTYGDIIPPSLGVTQGNKPNKG